jgi:SPP1 gp7 family putative phage head morphogenesis protein
MNRRWNKHKRDIRVSIVDRDCFGIQPDRLLVAAATEPRQYAFLTTAQKIDRFMAWLALEEQQGILEIPRGFGLRFQEAPWTDEFIRAAYQQGVRRGRVELGRAGYAVQPINTITGGAATLIASQPHLDRIQVLYTRVFEDLTGLARGIAEGKHPRVIARELMKDTTNHIDKIGKVRARMIARTEIIRAHHVATVVEYQEAARDIGAEDMEVMVEAEWYADFDACPICQDLASGGRNGDGVYPLSEIEGMLPAHPNCRCTILPVVRERKELRRAA